MSVNNKYTLEDIRRLKHIVALKMEAQRIGIQSTARQMITPRYPKVAGLLSWSGVVTACRTTLRVAYILRTAKSVFRLFRRR